MTAKSPHAPTTGGRLPLVYETGPTDFAAEGEVDTGAGKDTVREEPDPRDSAVDDREPGNGAIDDSAPEESGAESSADDEEPEAEPGVRRTPRVRPLVRRGRAPANGRLPKIRAAVWAASLPESDKPGTGGPGPDKPGTDEPGTEVPRPRSMTRVVLRLLPAVALVVLSVLLVIVWRQNAGLSEDARQRRDLNTSAGKVASTFFNWDYQHMDQSFGAKYPLLTKAAADAIRPTAATLTSYFTVNKVSSAANISGIYPGEIKGDAANVMVIINTKVTTSKSVQSNTGATVAISMKRVSGKWLAGNITLLSSGVESTTDQNGKPLASAKGTPPSTIPAQPTP